MTSPSFHADDWFTIADRGPVAVVVNHGYDDPRELRGDVVLIDGARYRVRGVEMNAVPGSHRNRPVGLLVEALD